MDSRQKWINWCIKHSLLRNVMSETTILVEAILDRAKEEIRQEYEQTIETNHALLEERIGELEACADPSARAAEAMNAVVAAKTARMRVEVAPLQGESFPGAERVEDGVAPESDEEPRHPVVISLIEGIEHIEVLRERAHLAAIGDTTWGTISETSQAERDFVAHVRSAVANGLPVCVPSETEPRKAPEPEEERVWVNMYPVEIEPARDVLFITDKQSAINDPVGEYQAFRHVGRGHIEPVAVRELEQVREEAKRAWRQGRELFYEAKQVRKELEQANAAREKLEAERRQTEDKLEERTEERNNLKWRLGQFQNNRNVVEKALEQARAELSGSLETVTLVGTAMTQLQAKHDELLAAAKVARNAYSAVSDFNKVTPRTNFERKMIALCALVAKGDGE